MLKSRNTCLYSSGHYLATSEDDDLTVLALPSFNEEIEATLADGQLRTDHRLYLEDQVFVILLYTIERVAGD